MIGRNRYDDPKEEDTVYIVGSDRISTELHNLNEDANAKLPKPMTLDYEMNDPADPESIYTRSDHYSYAAKGIPIIFYTTGLHQDYHYVTDEVSKDRLPEAGAHHAACLCHRHESGEPRPRPRPRPQGPEGGEREQVKGKGREKGKGKAPAARARGRRVAPRSGAPERPRAGVGPREQVRNGATV